jgi:hypothetical protein
MTRLLQTIIYCTFAIGITSCSFYKVASKNQADTKVTQTSQVSQDCDNWDKQYQSLREEDKKIVQEEGIVMSSDGWMIGSKIIADCSFRTQMATYLYRYRLDNDKWASDFANKNSKEIVEFLRKIWNTPHFSVDGNHHEKYALLVSDGLKDEDIVPFIKELIETEGLRDDEDTGFYWVLLQKPNESYRPLLLKFLIEAESKNDLSYQALLLIILEKEKSDSEYVVKLEKLSKNNKFDLDSRKILSGIISKMKKGEQLSDEDYRDFDSFYISNR